MRKRKKPTSMADIVEWIARHPGEELVSPKIVEIVLERFFGVIASELKQGRTVDLRRFGKFYTYVTVSREYVMPHGQSGGGGNKIGKWSAYKTFNKEIK